MATIITASTLDGVPGETSFGPNINEYPQNKPSESPTWLEGIQQVGLFFLAAVTHPREMDQAFKDYLKPEE